MIESTQVISQKEIELKIKRLKKADSLAAVMIVLEMYGLEWDEEVAMIIWSLIEKGRK
jgi:hypothetical protein